MITMGLVIGSPWIEKILAGEKTWEIRNREEPSRHVLRGVPVTEVPVLLSVDAWRSSNARFSFVSPQNTS